MLAGRDSILRAAAESFSVIRTGVGLWLRHWPVLLTIALLGVAGREAANWAAIEISALQGTLGMLVLAFAPISAVVSIIFMLYTLRPSLPAVHRLQYLPGHDDPITHEEQGLPDIMASVLVPFLFLYGMYGWLEADISRFQNAAFAREFFAHAATANFDGNRFVFATGPILFLVIVLALTLRWAMGHLQGKTGWRGFGYLGAYVEVIWLGMVGATYYQLRDDIGAWLTSRQGADIAFGWWDQLVDALGPVGPPVDAAGSWVLGLWEVVEPVLIFPGAWLLAGAVVYGHKLIPPAEEEDTPIWRKGWLARAIGIIGDLFHHIRFRFRNLVGGVKVLLRGGLVPMGVFALTLLVAQQVEHVLLLAVRALVGPQDVDTWLAFSSHTSAVTRALALTLMVCLVGAAIDHVLARTGLKEVTDEEEDEEDAAEDPEPVGSG